MSENKNTNMFDVFAKRLVEARKDKHLTQQEVANEIKIATSTLSSYENLTPSQLEQGKATGDSNDKMSRKTPNICTAYQLSKVLGVSLDWLCGLSAHKNNDVTMLHTIADMLENNHGSWRVVTDVSEVEEDELGVRECTKTYHVAIGTNDIRIYNFVREYENALEVIQAAQNVSEEYELPADVAKNMKMSLLNKHSKILDEEQGGV